MITIVKKPTNFTNIGKYYSEDDKVILKLQDHTLKDLRERTKSNQLTQTQRAKYIAGIAYNGLNQYGDLKFSCASQDKSKRYHQLVRFYDLNDRIPTSRDEILDMMLNSDVGIDCDDPSFQFWGGAYNATIGKYNIRIENRGLHDPNLAKKQKFTLCKHLLQVLTAVPFYWNNIIRDYVKYFDLKTSNEKPEDKVEEPVKEEVDDQNTEEETE